MTISILPVVIGVAGFVYLIMTLQVSGGFPPFYEKGTVEDDIKLILPYMLALLAVAAAMFFVSPYFLALLGLVAGWAGTRVRNRVRERTRGPRPWLLNPLTIGWMTRWPMLLFDAWTIGISALMGLLILPR